MSSPFTQCELKALVEQELHVVLQEKGPTSNESTEFLSWLYSVVENFVCDNGGKRIRPLCFLMGFCAISKQQPSHNIIRLSVAFEMLHNSTLIHDDIMDEDELRRNKPTVWKAIQDRFLSTSSDQEYPGILFSKTSARDAVSFAIIMGNILYSLGAQILLGTPALPFYYQAFLSVNNGQVLDMSGTSSESAYLNMIEQKTSALLAAAAAAGAAVAGGSPEQIKAIESCMWKGGIVFQLFDDIMDITPSAQKGHAFASDVKAGKKTLLVLHTMAIAPKEVQHSLSRALSGSDVTNQMLEAAVAILHKWGTPYVRETIAAYAKEAKAALEPESLNLEARAKVFFSELIDFMADRNI